METIKKHGPAIIADVVKKAISQCVYDNQKCNYYVLMIITDGNIADLDHFLKIMTEIGEIPFSIIIAGIGNGEFKELK